MLWLQSLFQSFTTSAQTIWTGFADFVPVLLAAVVLVLVGVVLGHFFGKAVDQVVGLLKLDSLVEKLGVGKYFSRAGVKVNVGGFVGAVVKWFIIVLFVLEALNQLGLNQVSIFLQNILVYLPNIFVAILVLFAGLLIGEFLERVVVGATRATQVGKSRLLGAASRWAIWVFAGLVALYHLGIAAILSETIMNGLVIGVAVAFGLAFGLGGQQHASDLIQKIRDEASEK